MEVRPGYKRTEAGAIPEDWVAQPLGPNCEIITKGTTPTSIGRVFTDTGVSFLKAESLSENGRAIPDKVAFIDFATHALLKRSQLSEGDVLISIAGVLGRVGFVEKEDLPANINQALALVRLGKDTSLVRGFLFYCLRSPVVAKQIRDITVQAAQANISLRNVREFLLPVPPTKAEQEAIAEALSDADALIESLEQLLAKKRELKQGAMQELLTGKKRLPGFRGEWEAANLQSVVDRITGVWGANDSSPDHPRPIDIIRAGDISQGGLLTGSALRFLSDMEFAKAECRLDDILITTSGAGLGKAWWCDGRPSTAASNFVRILRPRRGRSNGRYLSYVLRTHVALKQLQEHTATSAYPNLRPTFFAAPWPSLPPISEQVAIAAILSELDAEIAALEARLAKARQLKQGMMQELLTGRIRLA